MAAKQSRRFTLTSYGVERPLIDEEFISYICGQREACPTTGNMHWQCYIETTKRRTQSSVIKHWRKTIPLPISVHIEIARGSAEENKTYCSKSESAVPDSFFEWGDPMKQGERSDLSQYVEAVKQGADEYTLMTEHTATWAKYHSLANRVRQVVAKRNQADRQLRVVWLFGPPGTGKTHSALAQARESQQRFFIAPSLQWFDGYEGEEILIIDDLSPQTFNHHRDFVLRLLDKYPLQLPIKGAFVTAMYTTVYITSNYMPHQFNCPPLLDRVHLLHTFEGTSHRQLHALP